MLHGRNNENILHMKELLFPWEKESFVPAMQHGWENWRAKEESRIACMRMLRANQSKELGPNYAAHVNVSRNAFFSSRSERKHFL